jgi:hypothetical protein
MLFELTEFYWIITIRAQNPTVEKLFQTGLVTVQVR